MDLISRQAAIDEIAFSKEMLNRVLDDMDVVGVDREKYAWGLGLIESLIDDIEELPSAQPERKTGEWIEDAKTYYEQLNERGLGVDEYTPYFTDDIACSVCLAKYSMIDNETQFFKFCPNCGAKMGGEDNATD